MAKKIQIENFTGAMAAFSKHQADVIAGLVKQYVIAERARILESVKDLDVPEEVLEIIKGKK